MNQATPASFKETLLEEMRGAWITLGEAHPKESFYSFGLFTTPCADYLNITASTEEGLAAVTADYVRRYGGDPFLSRTSLRWSPADSPLHGEGTRLLSKAQALREAMPSPYSDDPAAEECVLEIFDIAIAVLRQLDREGHFGVGEMRSRIVLGIWMGDQSDEDRIDFAEQLNPRPVVETYRRELAARNSAFQELSKRWRKEKGITPDN